MREVRGWRTGWEGARSKAVSLALACLLAGCVADDESADGAASGTGQAEDPGVGDTASDSGEDGAGEGGGDGAGVSLGAVPAVLEGVDLRVVNAVAPYDHDSNVDAQILEGALPNRFGRLWEECLVEEGFTDLPPRSDPSMAVEPDRDSPFFMANLAFPDADRLARDGLPLLEAGLVETVDGRDPEEWEIPPGFEEAAFECSQRVEEEYADINPEHDLWAQVRGAWEEVLAEIDASDEIGVLREGFSECLRDEGIPAEAAADERSMLGYVTGQRQRADSREDMVAVGERYGRIYGRCGRELFEARERLRGGERRVEFLAEHADAIRELDGFLYGDGGTP